MWLAPDACGHISTGLFPIGANTAGVSQCMLELNLCMYVCP